jgi:hypothetical protein
MARRDVYRWIFRQFDKNKSDEESERSDERFAEFPEAYRERIGKHYCRVKPWKGGRYLLIRMPENDHFQTESNRERAYNLARLYTRIFQLEAYVKLLERKDG